MPILGKMDVTIKIQEMPTCQVVENNWRHFKINCDGRIVSLTVRPKQWKRLEEAQANFPLWSATIAGKMGKSTPDGFELVDAGIQAFERKPREPKSEQSEAA